MRRCVIWHPNCRSEGGKLAGISGLQLAWDSGETEPPHLSPFVCGVARQVADMIKEVDKDGSGNLDFDEFLMMMAKVQGGPNEKELRSEMFRVSATAACAARHPVRSHHLL